jgi:hypothetical protein
VAIKDCVPVNSSRVLRLVSGISRVRKLPRSLQIRTSHTKEVHEKSEDFHKMVNPRVGSSFVLQCSGHGLSNDGTNLATARGYAVRGRPVSGWKHFTWYNEGGGIGTEVLEEIAETIKSKESASRNDMVSETDNTEQDGENNEAHELNGLTADGVNRCNGDPVAGDQAGARQNDIPNT